MNDKTDLEKIRMAVELRRRGYSLDVDLCKYNKEYFMGCMSAMVELLRKLQDIKYIESYIQQKQKYMSEKEKYEWIPELLEEK